MYAFNWALTAFRSESYIGSATALPDAHGAERVNDVMDSGEYSSKDSISCKDFVTLRVV